MKKRFLTTVLCMGLALSMTACAGGNGEADTKALQLLEEKIEDLSNENAQLKEKLAELEGQEDRKEVANGALDKLISEMTVEEQGICGASLTWKYGNGILVISGTGKMTEYDRAPWKEIDGRVEHIYLEEGVTSIASSAFSGLDCLSYVSIPSTLTAVGRYAFAGCNQLQEIDLSKTSVTSIEEKAFYQASSLSCVSFPSMLTTVDSCAFFECDQLEEIDLSKTSVVSIGDRAFVGEKMKYCKLPSTLQKVGSGFVVALSKSSSENPVGADGRIEPGTAWVRVRVLERRISYLFNDGVSVSWNGSTYTENDQLAEAMHQAGVKTIEGEDLVYDTYTTHEMLKDRYTPEMGEIIEEGVY